MMPTLLIGDSILVQRSAYRIPFLNRGVMELSDPDRGEVVVFRYPVDPQQDYIMRIVGLPGDEFVHRNEGLYIS